MELYCRRVAVAVGYLSIKIFGLRIQKEKICLFFGFSVQLTNIARDFREDLEIGRCYLPYVKLKKYGIKNIKDLEKTNKIQEVLQDILRDADYFFKKAMKYQ